MREGLEYRDQLIGLLGIMLTPIKDYLNLISCGSKLYVVCEISDAEIGMIPAGVAKTPEEALELAHDLASKVMNSIVEDDMGRSLTITPSVDRFQIVEVSRLALGPP